MTLIAAGPRMTTNRTGRKNRIIGTVSLGGRAAALFSASDMRMIAIFLRQYPHGGTERRAITLRLLQRETDGLHAFEAHALRQIVVGLPAVRQIGKLGGRQRQLLRELDRLRPDNARLIEV